MMKHVELELGEYGRRAVIISAWSPEMLDYLLANEVVELELNYAKGWRGKDLSFLASLSHLHLFKIIDWNIPSVHPIHLLHALRTLEVSTYCRTEIRFSAFPQLEECALEWRPKAISLFGCTTLRKLFLNRYTAKDVASFSNLVNLESLAILNAPVENLYGLRALKRLRSLRLAGLKKLSSLAGIEELGSLEELEIHTCRAISSIGEVETLSQLRKLHLNNDGDIESLKPLEKLEGLESVLFYETTNIVDGDLSPLTRQKNLARVSFKNRRHYSHRREDFGAAYAR
jgi:hypothetical protein